jgi:peptide/nickel transport system substrate-binding protein
VVNRESSQPAAAGRTADERFAHNTAVASYSVNPRAVARAERLIDARQYVLRSEWGDVQPSAADENAYLESHPWEEYAEWHLGLTEGARDCTKARYAFVYGDFRRIHRSGIIACHYRAAATTAPRSGGTRRSSWPPTSCSSGSTPGAADRSRRARDGRRTCVRSPRHRPPAGVPPAPPTPFCLTPIGDPMFDKRWWTAGLAVVALALASGCGSDEGGSTAANTGGGEAGGRGGTMILLANANPGTVDPAINYTLQLWQLYIAVYDGLVAFKRVGGEEGTELVPDLATAIPEPQDNGRTYTFEVRRGIKYSNGATVKPSDFKFTIERMFKVHGPTTGSFYSVIKGADACLKNAETCDLADGIVPDDDAYTITFHLAQPDPEFLSKLALPFAFVIPPDSPIEDVGSSPLPGTGPYMIEEYIPNKDLKLVRNPHFKEWSKDAQPDGNPDVIIEKFGLTVEAEVTQVQNGQADWVYDPLPGDRLGEIGTRFADQAHVNPLTSTWYVAFNTNIPPFDNLQARQAVNYALDREALVKIIGGPQLGQPTCQVLPPNFPGYEPYCPYTANPDSSGKWTAPDMTKAQQLMDQSGTAGQKVTFITTTDEVGKSLGNYMVGLLNQLGYDASFKALGGGPQYEYIQNSDNKVQVSYSSWYQDYPAASDFINVLLSCESFHPGSNASPNIAGFCDENIDADIAEALKLAITDPDAANELWAKIDKEITDQAPWAAMFNPKLVDFVSKRVKGYQFSPQWYFLIPQASVQ